MSAVEPGGGSTVRRILLGAQLRRVGEAAGYSRGDAGYAIRATASKMSRLKLGRVSFKEHDVADPLSLHGVVDPNDRDSQLGLARAANAPGWWHRYSDVLPDCVPRAARLRCKFFEEDLPDFGYVEQLTGALYLDKREDPEDVDRYVEGTNRLSVGKRDAGNHDRHTQTDDG